jgi:hypothetical protein
MCQILDRLGNFDSINGHRCRFNRRRVSAARFASSGRPINWFLELSSNFPSSSDRYESFRGKTNPRLERKQEEGDPTIWR